MGAETTNESSDTTKDTEVRASAPNDAAGESMKDVDERDADAMSQLPVHDVRSDA